mgnify:FL=1
MHDINLTDFINTIFDAPVGDDARVCLSLKGKPGTGWGNYPATAKRMARYQPGPDAWYFCVSTVAPPNPDDGYMPRSRDCLRHAYCVVLDDIGTKVEPPPVEPSWVIETSEGNFQYGYLIDPMDMRDPAAQALYEGAVRALGLAGYGDKGAGGSYRVMRVPGSLHKTGFVATVRTWEPDRSWALPDLMAEMGVEPVPMRERRGGGGGGAGAGCGDFSALQDPTLDWLVATGRVAGDGNG